MQIFSRSYRESDQFLPIHDLKYSNLSELAENGPLATQSRRGIFRMFTFLRHLTSDIIINEIVHFRVRMYDRCLFVCVSVCTYMDVCMSVASGA